MFILIDLGWITLATTIFILFHFLFQRVTSWRRFVAFNIKFWNFEIISGFYYSIISLLIDLVLWYSTTFFFIPIGVLTSFVLITIRTSISAVVNMIPSLIFCLFLHDINFLTFVIYISSFSGMILYEILKFFLKFNWMSTLAMLFLSFIISIVFFVIYINKSRYNTQLVYESTILIPIFSSIMIIAVSYFISFFKSANLLFDIVTYAYLNFFRHPIGAIQIQNDIIKNKYKTALLLVFKHNIQGKPSFEDEKEIKMSFLKDVESIFSKTAIKYFISEDTHAIFLPMDFSSQQMLKSINGNLLKSRNKNDKLKEIEEKFLKTQKYYQTSSGNKLMIKVKVGVSIYGIHDNSLSNLEENALFVVNSFVSKANLKNIVSLFDPKIAHRTLNDSNKLKNIDRVFRLDNFENKFRLIYNRKIGDWIGCISILENNSEFNLENNVRDHIKFNNIIEDFDRYFAINTLKSFNKSNNFKIFLNYSPIIRNKEINFIDIKNKINYLNINFENVVFIIDEKPLNKWQFQNIICFQELGFKIAIFDIFDTNLFSKIKPDFLIITPKYFKNQINFSIDKIIFNDIKTMNQMRVAISNKAINFAGNIIKEEFNVKNFDISNKPSKIYVDDLIKINS